MFGLDLNITYVSVLWVYQAIIIVVYLYISYDSVVK